MRIETLSFIFDDIRKENGLEGMVAIYRKNDNEWVAVFRYEFEKNNKDNLVTKTAKVMTFSPSLALDEQFKYELTYYTKELFPKTFSSNLAIPIPTETKVKLKGFYTTVKVDEHGNPVLDGEGHRIMENKPFEA